jgi:Fe-S cluster assembly ATP-binding protein
MLTIKNLRARVEEKGAEILHGVDLTIQPGEVHAVMGPNGSGKSTLAKAITGAPGYDVTDGEVKLGDTDILDLEPDERAAAGIFLAFQYPVEIPGVNNMYFLRQAVNALRTANSRPEVDAKAFLELARAKAREMKMDESFLNRGLNDGFSGGEKKRNEIFQMAMLEPKFAILDETDSGLDIDALRVVAEGVNRLRTPERSMLVITHYQRLLNYIVPDYVHVMAGGRIVRSGGTELAQELEDKGYAFLESGASA